MSQRCGCLSCRLSVCPGLSLAPGRLLQATPFPPTSCSLGPLPVPPRRPHHAPLFLAVALPGWSLRTSPTCGRALTALHHPIQRYRAVARGLRCTFSFQLTVGCRWCSPGKWEDLWRWMVHCCCFPDHSGKQEHVVPDTLLTHVGRAGVISVSRDLLFLSSSDDPVNVAAP